MVEGPLAMFALALGGAVGLVLGVAFTAGTAYTLVGLRHWLRARRQRWAEGDEGGDDHLGATVVTEVVSAGALFALHPVGLVDPPTPSKNPLRSGRPILLVPGAFQARSSFVLLGPRLAAYGLGPLYTVNLHGGGLESHAAQLSQRIDEIRNATGAVQIDVVAHSTGGLVVRLAEAGRKQPRVRRLVTLGTPHRGTEVALTAFGSLAREIRPGSALLARLPPPPPGQLVSIGSTHDFVVVPTESAQVAPLGRDITVDHVGHLALLTDPGVSEEVVKALGEDLQLRRAADLFETVDVEAEMLVR